MPVDNIQATVTIHPPKEVRNHIATPFEWNSLLFSPVYDRYGLVNKYKAECKNLLFYMNQDELVIRNSLHKFYKGNNYCDFTRIDLSEAIYQLADLTKITPSAYKLNKLEVGLNLLLHKPAFEVLPLFMFYKGKEFDKKRNGSKLWGVECSLYEYLIKFYDKAIQIMKTEKLNINANILRFEITYHRSRKIPVDTLEDLITKEKIDILMKAYMNIFKSITFREEIDFSRISPRKRELYHAGSQKQFWDMEKQLNKETAKSKKEKFNEIIELNKISNNKGLLLSLIHDKIEILTS